MPGFVDLHMHGGGGADVTDGPTEMARAVAFHRRHGTTRTLVSLLTQPVDRLLARLAYVAELTAAGEIAGVHLEGPYLAPARCGAQPVEHLLKPSTATLRSLLDAGRGCVRMVTLAPNCPAHWTWSVCSPGAALAALEAGATVEVINDGVHLHDALVRLAAGSAASLAGSTLTMDAAVRRAVRDVGLPIEVASAAASATPAGVLGIADRTGAIAAGLAADLVVLDDDLRIVGVMARGDWVPLPA